jgi:hypothetical protein
MPNCAERSCIVAVKFKSGIERVFFEGTIVDMDFSRFDKYIGLVVLSAWGEFDGDYFPWEELTFVKFMGVRNFSISYTMTDPDISLLREDDAPASLGTNCISLQRHPNGLRSAKISASSMDINIVFKDMEERLLSDAATEFIESIQGREKIFIRPDIEKLASMWEALKNRHDKSNPARKADK